MGGVEVFTVVDRDYFLGGAAMALTVSHHLPDAGITFLDHGLEPDQRAWLAARYRVVDPPDRLHPYAAKSFAVQHLDQLDPDGVLVLADADLVATGPWRDYVASARAGALVAAIDPQPERRFDEWCALFGVEGPVTPRPYVNSGLVFWSLRHHRALLERWAEICASLGERGGAQTFGSPATFGDQDVLDALLMTEFTATPVDVRPDTEIVVSATMYGCRTPDPASLTCIGPAGPVRALHSVQRDKPWRLRSARAVEGAAYARILRAVLAPEIRAGSAGGPFAPERVVPWLRPGPIGAARLAGPLALHALRRTAATAGRRGR